MKIILSRGANRATIEVEASSMTLAEAVESYGSVVGYRDGDIILVNGEVVELSTSLSTYGGELTLAFVPQSQKLG